MTLYKLTSNRTPKFPSSYGVLNIANCPELVRRGDIKFEKKFIDQFVVVFPTSHRFAGMAEVSLSQVLKTDSLTLVWGTNVRTVLDSEFKKAGRDFDPHYEVIVHDSLGGMVEGARGSPCSPEMPSPCYGNRVLRMRWWSGLQSGEP